MNRSVIFLVLAFAFVLIPIAVSGVSESEAQDALLDARLSIEEMQRSNLSVEYVQNAFDKAQDAFAGENMTALRRRAESLMSTNPQLASTIIEGLAEAENTDGKIGENYTLVVELSNQIQERKEATYDLLGRLQMLQADIDRMRANESLNLSVPLATLQDARSEFSKERLNRADELIDQAYMEIEDAIVDATWLRARFESSQRTFINYLLQNPFKVAGVLLFLTVALLVLINELGVHKHRQRIADMDLEKTLMEHLKRENEKSYFQKKNISKSIYTIKVERNINRLQQLSEKKPVEESLLKQSLKRRRLYMPWKR